MNTIIIVSGKNLSVQFEEHIIRITINNELTSLLHQNTEAATQEIITKVKTAYYQQFGKDFEVTNASMAVEIWAHIYTEKLAEAIKSLSLFEFADTMADKIIERCEVIDIGESGHDNNRFVWNALSVFKQPIAALLPTSEIANS